MAERAQPHLSLTGQGLCQSLKPDIVLWHEPWWRWQPVGIPRCLCWLLSLTHNWVLCLQSIASHSSWVKMGRKVFVSKRAPEGNYVKPQCWVCSDGKMWLVALSKGSVRLAPRSKQWQSRLPDPCPAGGNDALGVGGSGCQGQRVRLHHFPCRTCSSLFHVLSG